MLTPQQVQSIKNSVSTGGNQVYNSPEQAKSAFSSSSNSGSSNLFANAIDYGKQVGQAATSGINQIGNSFQDFAKAGKDINPVEATEAVTKGLAGAVNTIASPASPLINATVGKGINTVSNAISNSPTVQKFAQSPAGQTTERLAGDVVNTSTVAGAVGGAMDVAGMGKPTIGSNEMDVIDNTLKTGNDMIKDPDFATSGQTPQVAMSSIRDDIATNLQKFPNVANAVKNLDVTKFNSIDQLGQAIKDVVKNPPVPSIPPEAPILNEKAVLDSYNRSIKPSITGKNTASQLAKSNTQVVSGLKTIADNKTSLQFTDSEGNIVKGQSPETVDQLSQAIQQTKTNLFKQYNDLAIQAGEKGISVDPVKIGTELSNVINNKALRISNPDAINYAQGLQERLIKEGSIDAETAQQVVQNFNDELKTFYRNPTPGMASRVQIDAMVANRMRTQLDEGITSATGKEYQTLKNQYGALSSMEADVAKSAARIAKQSKVGFAANISNIASGAELVRGLLTGNPLDIGISATMKGIQLYQKYLNNPDVGIKNIFNEIEKASPSTTGNSIQGVAPEKSNIASPKSNISPTKSQPENQPLNTKVGLKNTQGGFAKIPFSKAKPSNAEIGTLHDYTDYAYGNYKPTPEEGLKLEDDAGEIMQKYGITTRANPKATSKEIAKFLDQYES